MNLRRLAHNMASVTVLRLGMAALGFGQFWLISRRLDAEGLGGFSLLMGLFFMLQALPLLGLGTPLIRRIATHPDTLAAELSNTLAFALPWALLLALGLGVYGLGWGPASLTWPFALLGLSMLPSAWTAVAEGGLIGLEAMQSIAIVNLLEACWRMAGTWLALQQGWGLMGVMALFLAGRMGAALAYLLHPRLPHPRWRAVTAHQQALCRAEVPTYLGLTLATALAARLDTVLLSHLRGLNELAVYAAASRLYEASLMLSTISVVVVFPMLSKLFIHDRGAFADLLGRCLHWGLLGGVPLVLTGMALAPVVVHVVYKPSLWGAAAVLQWFMIAAWLMALDQLLSTTMVAAEAQQQDLLAMVLGLVTTVALIVVLSQRFGLEGAAIAVSLGLAVRVTRRCWWASRHLSLHALPSFGLRAGVAALTAVAVFEFMVHDAPAADVPRALGPAWLCGLATHVVLARLLGAWTDVHRADWRRLSGRMLNRRAA